MLGALLAAPGGIALVDGWLTPEAFYREGHRRIYAACQGLYRAGQVGDLTTVADVLDQQGVLAPLGGAEYLSVLLFGVPSACAVEDYGRLVERDAVRRALIAAGGDLQRLGYDGADDLGELLGHADRLVRDVTDRPGTTGFVAVRDHLPAFTAELAQPRTRPPGWTTGLHAVDDLVRWRPGQFIVPAGRPGTGKTAFALGCALAAAQEGARVGIISIEMGTEEVLQRLMSMVGGVDLHVLRTGDLTAEWDHIGAGRGILEDMPLYLLDAGRVSVPQIRGHLLQLQAREGLDLVIVDYLQLIKPATRGRGGENRTQEVDAISRDLKGLARDLRVPMIVPAQLSRAIEDPHRKDRTPQLSDLRESGSIEADADIVVFLHRPDASRWELAEVHVAKHRNGPTGKVPVYWHGSTVRFWDRDTCYN